MTNEEAIKGRLTEEQIRSQMAEEADELHQALSKWQGAHDNVPGWQVDEATALEMATEEMADVALCGNLLGIYVMPNVRPPVDVRAAKRNAAELLWTLESGEPAATKISLLTGRIYAWLETLGEKSVIATKVWEVMDAKAARWRERLENTDAVD